MAGAGGMLGRDVSAAARERGHDVVGLAHSALDITDPASVERAIALHAPDVVVNCAACTDVDGAEANERGAMRVNDEAAASLAAAAASVGRQDRPPLERLRLRRHHAPSLRRVRRHRPRSRPTAAPSRPARPRSRSPTRVTSSSAPRGCSGSAARTSSRRCCGSATSSPRCSSSPTRSARPTYTRHLGEALAELIERDEFGIHHIARPRAGAPGTSSPRRSSTRRASSAA